MNPMVFIARYMLYMAVFTGLICLMGGWAIVVGDLSLSWAMKAGMLLLVLFFNVMAIYKVSILKKGQFSDAPQQIALAVVHFMAFPFLFVPLFKNELATVADVPAVFAILIQTILLILSASALMNGKKTSGTED